MNKNSLSILAVGAFVTLLYVTWQHEAWLMAGALAAAFLIEIAKD